MLIGKMFRVWILAALATLSFLGQVQCDDYSDHLRASSSITQPSLAQAFGSPRALLNDPDKEEADPFEFEYIIKKFNENLDFGHQEESDGNTVSGEYFVLLPDGRKQTVIYTADDKNGYVARVSYEKESDIPTENSGPGDELFQEQSAISSQIHQEAQQLEELNRLTEQLIKRYQDTNPATQVFEPLDQSTTPFSQRTNKKYHDAKQTTEHFQNQISQSSSQQFDNSNHISQQLTLTEPNLQSSQQIQEPLLSIEIQELQDSISQLQDSLLTQQPSQQTNQFPSQIGYQYQESQDPFLIQQLSQQSNQFPLQIGYQYTEPQNSRIIQQSSQQSNQSPSKIGYQYQEPQQSFFPAQPVEQPFLPSLDLRQSEIELQKVQRVNKQYQQDQQLISPSQDQLNSQVPQQNLQHVSSFQRVTSPQLNPVEIPDQVFQQLKQSVSDLQNAVQFSQEYQQPQQSLSQLQLTKQYSQQDLLPQQSGSQLQQTQQYSKHSPKYQEPQSPSIQSKSLTPFTQQNYRQQFLDPLLEINQRHQQPQRSTSQLLQLEQPLQSNFLDQQLQAPLQSDFQLQEVQLNEEYQTPQQSAFQSQRINQIGQLTQGPLHSFTKLHIPEHQLPLESIPQTLQLSHQRELPLLQQQQTSPHLFQENQQDQGFQGPQLSFYQAQQLSALSELFR